VTSENVFVVFTFCNPTVNFGGNGNGIPSRTYKYIVRLVVHFDFHTRFEERITYGSRGLSVFKIRHPELSATSDIFLNFLAVT
jgi:hypothetical protein